MEASPRFSLSRGLSPRAPGDKPARVFRAQTAALRLLGDPLLCQALNEIISDSLSQRPIHTGRARVTAVAQVQSRGGELPHARVRPEEKEPADQDPADCAKPSPRHASVQLRGLSAGQDCGVSRPRTPGWVGVQGWLLGAARANTAPQSRPRASKTVPQPSWELPTLRTSLLSVTLATRAPALHAATARHPQRAPHTLTPQPSPRRSPQ